MSFDYTTLGHVTVDVMADGSRRPGGGAFYSALQAARLGLHTLIVTQGRPSDIKELLAPFASELELRIRPALRSTTLATSGTGNARRQRLVSWAGELAADVDVDSAILHLAPVARETPSHWRGRAAFIALTPQGLTRTWPTEGGELSQVELDRSRVPSRCDAIVLGEQERASCAALLSGADAVPPPLRAGAERATVRPPRTPDPIIAVTAQGAPTELHRSGRVIGTVPVAAIDDVADDLGAGDVFAAAFFVALHDGADPERAARFGHAAAAVRLGAAGPGAVGRREEIEDQLRAGA